MHQYYTQTDKHIARRIIRTVTRLKTVLEGHRTDSDTYFIRRNYTRWKDKNSSGDEIANVNFYAMRPEATRIRGNNAK